MVKKSTAELANGSEVEISKYVKGEFHIENDVTTVYKTELRLLSGLTTNVILGNAFLQENNAIINFKESTLTLDGKEYETKNIINNEENYLMEKTKIYMCEKKENFEENLRKLIRENKNNNPILGTFKNIKHQIMLKNKDPISHKGYPIPLKLIEETKYELNKLEEMNVIRRSKSIYCSPAFPILKKNGKIRLVVDYRQLNKQTIPASYPIPQIRDYLYQLSGSKVFSQIDLNMGYYQIAMHEDDIEKTGFTICNQQYEFLKMPFGLSNAPRTFQRAMYTLFEDCDFIKVYLDDILIHSANIEEHVNHLKCVFKRSSNINASINYEKSKFNVESICYL